MKRLIVSRRTNKWALNLVLLLSLFLLSCSGSKDSIQENRTAAEILGNPAFSAISYGGYRSTTRKIQPSIEQLKADIQILHAMGIRLLRTYNLQFEHTPNLLKAIHELQIENPSFEMYVMLGTWIDCKNAWTDNPDHTQENLVNNTSEIEKAIVLANKYPEIIKIIAVGNEAMVHWAWSYHVAPKVILKWVNHLQQLKSEKKLPKELWITSSDNFASWGGGDASYHNSDLTSLMRAVDYLSVHTYPFHDTHYNPSFWKKVPGDNLTTKDERIDFAMEQATNYAKMQYAQVKTHMQSLGIDKPIHIGETGWATKSNGFYGAKGSRAADEYKQALYFTKMLDWATKNNITMIYFSAFDESWKDDNSPDASENNFGLFTIEGKAKYALWPLIDKGIFKVLSREENGMPVEKTYDGKESVIWAITNELND
tara:strand:- start:3602 stop:4879 length:1278 start_codon:yes stop_codon:yes gene_type:complete